MGDEFAFHFNLVHGRCVGVCIPTEVDDRLLDVLFPEERTLVSALAPARRPSWVAGRIALRQAFRDLGLEPGPILMNRHGAPDLPPDLAGSISHKKTLAVGLAARAENRTCLGVDLEDIPPLPASVEEARAQARPDIRARVLTKDELAQLERVPEQARRRQVLLHFSLKEALYKALHPLVIRHVGFHEASVTPLPDGGVRVTLSLSEDQGTFDAECTWTEIQRHFLTTAKVRRR